MRNRISLLFTAFHQSGQSRLQICHCRRQTKQKVERTSLTPIMSKITGNNSRCFLHHGTFLLVPMSPTLNSSPSHLQVHQNSTGRVGSRRSVGRPRPLPLAARAECRALYHTGSTPEITLPGQLRHLHLPTPTSPPTPTSQTHPASFFFLLPRAEAADKSHRV